MSPASGGRERERERDRKMRSANIAALRMLREGRANRIEAVAMVQGYKNNYHQMGPHVARVQYEEAARKLKGLPICAEHRDGEWGAHEFGQVGDSWVDEHGNWMARFSIDASPNAPNSNRELAERIVARKMPAVSFGQKDVEYYNGEFGLMVTKQTLDELSVVEEPGVFEAFIHSVRVSGRSSDGVSSDEIDVPMFSPACDPNDARYQYGHAKPTKRASAPSRVGASAFSGRARTSARSQFLASRIGASARAVDVAALFARPHVMSQPAATTGAAQGASTPVHETTPPPPAQVGATATATPPATPSVPAATPAAATPVSTSTLTPPPAAARPQAAAQAQSAAAAPAQTPVPESESAKLKALKELAASEGKSVDDILTEWATIAEKKKAEERALKEAEEKAKREAEDRTYNELANSTEAYAQHVAEQDGGDAPSSTENGVDRTLVKPHAEQLKELAARFRDPATRSNVLSTKDMQLLAAVAAFGRDSSNVPVAGIRGVEALTRETTQERADAFMRSNYGISLEQVQQIAEAAKVHGTASTTFGLGALSQNVGASATPVSAPAPASAPTPTPAVTHGTPSTLTSSETFWAVLRGSTNANAGANTGTPAPASAMPASVGASANGAPASATSTSYDALGSQLCSVVVASARTGSGSGSGNATGGRGARSDQYPTLGVLAVDDGGTGEATRKDIAALRETAPALVDHMFIPGTRIGASAKARKNMGQEADYYDRYFSTLPTGQMHPAFGEKVRELANSVRHLAEEDRHPERHHPAYMYGSRVGASGTGYDKGITTLGRRGTSSALVMEGINRDLVEAVRLARQPPPEIDWNNAPAMLKKLAIGRRIGPYATDGSVEASRMVADVNSRVAGASGQDWSRSRPNSTPNSGIDARPMMSRLDAEAEAENPSSTIGASASAGRSSVFSKRARFDADAVEA